jgi:hypothetical protein
MGVTFLEKFRNAYRAMLLLFVSCYGLWAASLSVEPFESVEGMRISGGHAAGSLALSSEIKKAGNHSLKFVYKLPSGSWTWSDIHLSFQRELPAAAGKIGFWVYGNKSGNRIVFTVHDASGEWFQYLTWSADSILNWAPAWKWIEIDLTKFSRHSGGNADGIVDAPARLANIILQAPPFTDEETIYLDDLTFTAENVGCVKGTVIDELSALPIADATIAVSEVPTSATKTDSQGNFSLFAPQGTHNLVISRSGYDQQVSSVSIAVEEVLQISACTLTPSLSD